ncbi:hypothetical protein OJ997_18620 [Solirubrobacter phytolaccae]|uniref:Uncharacterized protein n=1 Tax=Solirubrobacter phytolaccae TaxID=1404360 RepID=A0A9X3S960_9ACTN|nr:hypothetical protein [Solirubrobacter phytolaccae]MDA0182328.1 hypothetical protein [Solirubrobacter phytolaccae]
MNLAAAAIALTFAAPAQDPADDLATCTAHRPGPEPGRTVLQLCVPRLVKAWADNGLVSVPEARRLQPIPRPGLVFGSFGGSPEALRLDGGVRKLAGRRLHNRARVAITTRIDVVSWDGQTRYARSGHRQLRLAPDTRIRVRGRTVIELVSSTGTTRIPLRQSSTAEDS